MSQHDADNSELTVPQAASDTAVGVGYGRPPKHTRFLKGKSGNPKGRPKGVRNFATVIEAELNTKISVTENGKRKSISKREAIAKQLVNKAATGDPRAIPILLNESRAQEKASSGLEVEPRQRVEDQQVMKSILERIRRSMSGSTPSDLATADNDRAPD